MFLHLGEDFLIDMKSIIVIIDMEKKYSEITNQFIQTAKEEGFLEKISNNEIKSLIVTEINNKSKVFLSPIASSTLLKRTSFVDNIPNKKWYIKK